MQHIYSTADCVKLELSERAATRLKLFAQYQAQSGGDWGRYWQRIAEATGRGLEQLGEARRAERENGHISGVS